MKKKAPTAEERHHQENAAKCKAELKSKPNDMDLFYRLGYSLQILGELEEALSCFESALRLRPDHGVLLNACGVAHLKLGRLDRALEYTKQAVDAAPKSPEFLADYADVLRTLNRRDEARAAYLKAMKLTIPGEEVLDQIDAGLDALET